MNSPAPRESFTAKEWRLIQRLNTPAKVQHWLTALPYNWERNGGTMRSFREVVKRNEAHCLEAFGDLGSLRRARGLYKEALAGLTQQLGELHPTTRNVSKLAAELERQHF